LCCSFFTARGQFITHEYFVPEHKRPSPMTRQVDADGSIHLKGALAEQMGVVSPNNTPSYVESPYKHPRLAFRMALSEDSREVEL
jgi:hypothetical protein